jgi:hypothetical protein
MASEQDAPEELDTEEILVDLIDHLGEFDDKAVTTARESALRRYGSPEKAIEAISKDLERLTGDFELHVTSIANTHGPKILALLQLEAEQSGGSGEADDDEDDEDDE